jgi:hypothetical protein
MPTEKLSSGMPWLMKAGVAYALPPEKCTLFTDAATPTITQSNTQAFTANSAVTLTGGMATLAGGFIKAAADTLVVVSRD